MKKYITTLLFSLGLFISLEAQTFTTVFQSLSENYPQIQLQSLNGKVNEISTINDGDFVIFMNGQVGDEKFRIEDETGFIGINNPVPSQQLDVTGSANVSSFLFSNHLRVAGNTDPNEWATGVNGNGIYREGKLWITTSTEDGIGPSDQGLNLENETSDVWTILNNSAGVQDLDLYYNDVLKGYFLDGSGEYMSVSDKNQKKNIESLPSVLSLINNLEAKKYHYKDTDGTGPKALGFMAQDAHPLFPELVSIEEGHMGINYAGFSVVAIKAIQEQQVIISDLATQLQEQKKMIEQFSALLKSLELDK